MELLNCPIIDEVKLKLAFVVEVAEQSSQVGIVWSLLEAQIAAISHVSRHLFWVAEAKSINWGIYFALLNLLILILLVSSPKPLPRQFSLK